MSRNYLSSHLDSGTWWRRRYSRRGKRELSSNLYGNLLDSVLEEGREERKGARSTEKGGGATKTVAGRLGHNNREVGRKSQDGIHDAL